MNESLVKHLRLHPQDRDEVNLSLTFSLDRVVQNGMEYIFNWRNELVQDPKVLFNIARFGEPMLLPNAIYTDVTPSQDDVLSKYFSSFGFTLVGEYDVSRYVKELILSEGDINTTSDERFLTSVIHTGKDTKCYIKDKVCYIRSTDDSVTYMLDLEEDVMDLYLSFECESKLLLNPYHTYTGKDEREKTYQDYHVGKWSNINVNVLFREDIFNVNSSSVTDLTFSSLKHIVKVCDNFLLKCRNLTHVDLKAFTGVGEIGKNFLSCCKSLVTIDLSPLSEVKKITNYFLAGCSNLISVDFIPMGSIEEVGHRFLTFCESLRTIDLRPFSNMKQINCDFLGNCKRLRPIDLSPLSGVKEWRDGDFSRLVKDHSTPVLDESAAGIFESYTITNILGNSYCALSYMGKENILREASLRGLDITLEIDSLGKELNSQLLRDFWVEDMVSNIEFLTGPENNFLRSYVNYGYQSQNGFLREYDSSKDPELNVAMSKQVPLPNDITVYRYTHSTDGIADEGEFTVQGYLSTSYLASDTFKRVMRNGNLLMMRIKIPKGTKCLLGASDEYELIFAHGSKCITTSVEEVTSGGKSFKLYNIQMLLSNS
jgi:hypothetical protein